MTLPVLLFQGGTHGNFLSRCLSISSGIEQDFDFYGNNAGAHANYDFARLVKHVHPYRYNARHAWCYIHVNQTDLYFVYWHVLKAGGEFGLDVLDVTSFNDIRSSIENKKCHVIVKDGFENQFNIFKDTGLPGLREMFKLSFKPSNGILLNQQQDYEKFEIANKFYFEWFYNYKNFKHNLIKLLTDLDKEYCYDIEHHWKDFTNRKQKIIQSKLAVERAMECFISKSNMDISNFCVYQQAYLDHLVEQYLDYEIELWHNGYPQNMFDYKPVQATRD